MPAANHFCDALDHQFPSGTPTASVTPSQPRKDAGSSDFTSVTSGANVTDKNTLQPSNGAGCDGVTDSEAVAGKGDEEDL